MARCKLLFADTDLSFLEPIELLLLREHSASVSLELVTDPEYLARAFREPQRLDMLVINERLWREEFRRQDIRQVIFLCENAGSPARTENGDIRLYKYTSARDIFSAISVMLRRWTEPGDAQEARVIAVYSPQGGSGKTTVAAGICAELAGMGCRVLFVETESLQSTSGIVPESPFASDAFVRQLRAGAVSPETLRANIGTAAFDYVLPMQYAMTSYGAGEAGCAAVVQTARQMRYDYIVADCSSDFNEAKTSLMKMAQYVVLPFVPTRSGVSKYSRFLCCVNAADREKFLFVRNMDDGPARCAGSSPEFDLSLRVVPGLREADGPQQLVEALARSGAFSELIYRFL